MRLTSRIMYPTVVNDSICGQALNILPDTSTIRVYSSLGDICPLQTLAALDASVIVSNYAKVQDNTMALVSVKYDTGIGVLNITADLINIWDYVSITIEINSSTYHSYSNTFRIYGYDLGYTTSLFNNTPFDIVLVKDNYSVLPEHLHYNYSSFVSYRVPFTNKILIYKTNSSIVDDTYYINASTNEQLLLGTSGYICYDGDITIEQVSKLRNTVCTSIQTLTSVKWFPDFQIETQCINNCASQCEFTNKSDSSAKLNIDFSTISHALINNTDLPTSKDFELDFDLYQYDGSLLSSQKQSFNYATTDGVFYSYNINDYLFLFTTPTVGDYEIVGTLKLLGAYQTVIISGSLINLQEYIITGSTTTSDFIVAGSADNNIGTRFISNGTDPDYNGGSVVAIYSNSTIPGSCYISDIPYRIRLITVGGDFTTCSTPANINKVDLSFISNGTVPISYGNTPYSYINEVIDVYNCKHSSILTSCNFYSITQINCNTFQINNLSTVDMNVTVSELTVTNGVAAMTSTGLIVTVPALSNNNIIHNTDGIYSYSINVGTVQMPIYEIYLSVVLCDLETCLLAKIKDLNCKCDIPCKDEDWYNFNALATEIYVFFNLLNNEFNFNYIYSIIDNTKLAELYEIKKVMDRFADYCGSCIKPCNCGQ